METILDFWFGDIDADGYTSDDQWDLWFGKDADTDEDVRMLFQPRVEEAARGDLDEWEAGPPGTLALLLLLDQFPRNIFRDTPQAFAYDDKAQSICLRGLDRGFHLDLHPIQRVFFYMPLEHAEDAALQARCVQLFEQLQKDAPKGREKAFEGFLDYARQHQAVIDRFGRFPHRNAILGRESTEEELAFLKEPGSGF